MNNLRYKICEMMPQTLKGSKDVEIEAPSGRNTKTKKTNCRSFCGRLMFFDCSSRDWKRCEKPLPRC